MKINKQLNRNNIDLMNIIYIDRCSGEIFDSPASPSIAMRVMQSCKSGRVFQVGIGFGPGSGRVRPELVGPFTTLGEAFFKNRTFCLSIIWLLCNKTNLRKFVILLICYNCSTTKHKI